MWSRYTYILALSVKATSMLLVYSEQLHTPQPYTVCAQWRQPRLHCVQCTYTSTVLLWEVQTWASLNYSAFECFRELREEHRERRVYDVYALMADIIHSQPKSSQEDSKENYRQLTIASGTQVLSHPTVPSTPARRANRPLPPVGTTWRKSTG